MRILLADDDRELGEFVKAGLGREGIRVEVVNDGPWALEASLHGGHDAILLDLGVPNMNGFELLRKLRMHGNEVPILVLSKVRKEQEMLHALNSGADDYISKPFKLPEIVARLRAVLRRTARGPSASRTSKPSLLRAGKLKLNLLRRELTCAEEVIPLTKTEFDLMECFMRRPGDVISQSVLCQQVFRNEANLNSNSLPVHINNLRRKIDGSSSRSLIRTVRGCGYALGI
jgi:two-component system, OmpR family, response regulator MprA